MYFGSLYYFLEYLNKNSILEKEKTWTVVANSGPRPNGASPGHGQNPHVLTRTVPVRRAHAVARSSAAARSERCSEVWRWDTGNEGWRRQVGYHWQRLTEVMGWWRGGSGWRCLTAAASERGWLAMMGRAPAALDKGEGGETWTNPREKRRSGSAH
jgi:hypothetical protein